MRPSRCAAGQVPCAGAAFGSHGNRFRRPLSHGALFLTDLQIMVVKKAIAFIEETSQCAAIADLISEASHVEDRGVSRLDKFNSVFEAACAAYYDFLKNGTLDVLIDLGTCVLHQTIQALDDRRQFTFGFA